jgi:hypothetical protein
MPQVCHAVQVQQDAAAVVAECGDSASKETRALANFGAAGQCPANVERDMMRWVKAHIPLPGKVELYMVEVTIVDPGSLGFTTARLPLLLPHELFASLHAAGDTVWMKGVLGRGGQQALKVFWDELQHMEWVQRHPGVADWERRGTLIPIGFYGDGAQFTKEESMTALTWSSLMGTGPSLDTRFLITAVPTTWLAPTTLDEIFAVLAWSFAAMLDGFYPPVDHKGCAWKSGPRAEVAGTLLAGGYRAGWAESRGDWDWQVKCYRLRGWSHNSCCHLCDATVDGALVYTNFSSDAPWRGTLVSHDVWMAAAEEHQHGLCPLCAVPGWHLQSIKIDTMHTLCLGLGRHVNGNLVLELCAEGVYGRGPRSDKLKRCWLEFRHWCANNGVSCSQKCFTKERVRLVQTDHPELRTKAWNSRLFSAFLAHKLGTACPLEGNGALRATLAWAVAEFYLVMEMEGRFMSGEGVQRLAFAGQAMLQVYHALAQEAAENGRAMYGLRPKMHMLSHLIAQVETDKVNPRFFHCFKDEDMIGRTVKVAAKCHRTTISLRMMERYMLRLCLRWRGFAPAAARRQFHKAARALRRTKFVRP